MLSGQVQPWVGAGSRKVNTLAEKLDPKDLVTLEDLAITNMWETSALVELLERNGITLSLPKGKG